MNDITTNDVDRALAAFGAQPMKYRSFERHRLPAAAHAASPVLDDMAFDPFAPQPVMHALDETLPDVLLPTTSLVEVMAADGGTKAPPPALPPEPAQVDAARFMPAPTPFQPPIPSSLLKTAAPTPTQAAARSVADLSLPTLGAKFAALDKPRMEARDETMSVRSLHDMFQMLNGKPDLMRRQPGSSLI